MKRLFALILALAMVLSMVPPTALQVHAEEVTPPEETTSATVAPEETEPLTVTEPVPETTQETVPETVPETELIAGETGPAATEPVTVICTGTVNVDGLNVRAEPGPSGPVLMQLPIGTRVEILEQQNIDGFIYGRIAEGWINMDYVTLDGSEPTAPETEPTVPETEPEFGNPCGENVYWSLEDGVLTIWGEGEMECVEYDWPWEDQREAITTVVIDDGVTYIGDDAFDRCSNLTSVTIPNSVTSIGGAAFRDCSSLASITIPTGVTYINESAFNSCSSLTSIEIPDSVTFIDMFAFSYCSGLTNLTIPDSVTVINSYAFSDCTGLESVTIGNGVNLISTSAFYGCTGLAEITFKGDAPEMHSDVFYGVTATAYYPAGNETWTSDVMQDYYGTITWVSYDAEDIPPASSDNKCGLNAYWSLEDGVLTISGTGVMSDLSCQETPWYANAESITSVIVAEGITRIGNEAFCGLRNLASISLPEGLESIGSWAFESCESLSSIHIPESVTTLDHAAFAWCTGLESIHIPAGVTKISSSLFSNCESLQSVTFGGEITSIGHDAFSMCDLRSFTFPEGLVTIEYDAFAYNDNLTALPDLPATVTAIDVSAFAGLNNLTAITVSPENAVYCDVDGVLFNKDVTELLLFPASNCATYTVPGTVHTIGDYAFYFSNLEEITIPEGVETIGEIAFYGTELDSIHIPASVTSIGASVFTSSQLATIDVAADNPNYCDVDGVFFNKNATTLIAFPRNHSQVYTIPATVTTVDVNAFYGHDMVRVTVPATVNHIKSSAFGYFEGQLVFEGNAPSFQADNINYVFDGCDITAYYPADAEGWENVVNTELWDSTIEWIPYGEEGIPPLSNITKDTALPLEPEEPVFVEAAEYGYKYYTFTPHESGYYVIYTEGAACPDFAVYALNEDGHWIGGSWSNCSYDLGSLHLMPMIADRTYGFVLHYDGGQSDCYLTVEQSNITKVEIADVEIYEYSHGDYVQPEDYYRYDFSDLIHYTVYYDDGTQKTGPEVDSDGDTYNFRYIWKGYELYFSNPFGYAAIEQSEENQWTVGNSYDAYCSFLGSEHSLKVSIVEAPENVTINLKPIKVHKDAFEMVFGGIDANGDAVYYKHYRWIEAIGGTVTVNGTDCNLRLTYMGGDIFSWFYYDPDPTDETNGYKCQLWLKDNQSADNEWEVGGTYEVTVGTMGVETTVEVLVYDEWSGAEALTLNEPVCVENLEPGDNAHFTFTPAETGYYMFYTSGENTPEMGVYLLQPTGNWEYWGWENGWYENDTDEGYVCGYVRMMPMTAGTTYGFVSACGYEEPISFSAAVEKLDISGVEVTTEVNIYEYTHGHWDGYDGYWGETSGYYCYDNLAELIDYTVIHADGSRQTDSLENAELQLNGKHVRMNLSWIYGNNYQEADNRWTVGNSYELGIELFGQAYDYTVNILPAPENITLQLDPVTASVQDYDWHYENFGDGEEIEWRTYNWSRYINGTITIGTETYNIRNGRFYFPEAGYYCELWTRDAQAWDNLWSFGNTYAGTAGTLGVSAECDVTIANIEMFDSQLQELIDQAPALSDMIVLTPDTLHPFSVERGGEIGWFTFTPEEDGSYSFASSDAEDSDCDPRAWLFDSNWGVLGQNDDNGSPHFNIMHELTAGETYILAARLYNQDDIGTFNVSVTKALAVTKIQFDPISIPADAWCEAYMEPDGYGNEITTSYYYWWATLNGKLYFEDGNYVVINGTSVQYNGITYHLKTSDTQGDDVWVAGNSYPVTISCGNLTLETTVKITAPAIKSFSVKPVTMLESEDGYYNWASRTSWTATFKDGKKLSGNGSSFTYKKNTYIVSCWDDQYENPYLPGNTYTVYAMVGTHIAPVSLTIKDMDQNLPAVEQLSVKAVKPTSVQVGFTKVAGAVKYDLYRNGAYVATTTSNTYTFSDLVTGYYYEFGVAAVYNVDGKQVSSPVQYIIEKPCTSISNFTLALEYTSTAYDGTEKMPEVTLKNGKTVISPEFYEYQISNNVEIGQAVISVFGLQQYGGVLFKSFKILPQQVTELEVTEVTEDSATITFEPVYGADEYWIYNGTKKVAEITETTYTFEGLKAGTNYTFSVRANTVVEEVVLEGFDPYAGSEPSTRMADYTGEAATVSSKPTYEIDGFTVKLGSASVAYTGKKLQPSVTVLNENGKKLTAKKDYTVAYSDNVDVGTATVTVTGAGKYSGTLVTTFDIVPAKPKSGKVTGLSGTSAQLEIRAVAQAQWYDVYADDQYLGRTSELTYVAENLPTNKNIKFYVRAGATIEGKDYIGVMSPPAPVVLKHNMSICTVTLAETTLVYTGKKLQPEVTVTGHEGVVLTKGVDYTVSYTNNTGTGVATVTVTGKGAYTGKATAEFVIMPAPVTNLAVKSTTPTSVTISFTKTASAQYYYIYVDDAEPVKTTKTTYTIKDLAIGDIHNVYVVSEKTVKGVTYQSDPCAAIQVWAGTDIAKFNATLEYSRGTYEGQPLSPSVVLKTSTKKTATTLVEGVDYIIEYVGNDAPGKAKAVIKGIGQYSGSITKTFTIFMKNPTGVTATAIDPNTIHVEFDAVPGATKYQILVGSKVKATITEGTSCDITGLKKNTTYTIKVKAVYVSGTYTQNTTSAAVKVKTPSA